MVLWIIGIGYVVVIFLVQTLLLRTSQKRILHLLPLIMIGVVYLAAACLPALDGIMAELGRNDGYSFWGFTALLTAGMNTLGLFSVGAAWLIEKV